MLVCSDISAFHIIGGEVTYQCLGAGATTGTNRYLFEMYIYRDCREQSDEVAPLDDFANIGIWRGINGGYANVSQLSVGLERMEFVDPPEIECLIPPENICVQLGYYSWTVDLETITDNYHVTYQRCCRNNTISNINDPDAAGATFTMTLQPNAQSECNNSPTFREFPPTIVCVNSPLTFDHSAIDADGDSLAYAFVNPTTGGTQDMPVPNSGPPPYVPVSFRLPIYSFEQPLGGDNGDEPGVSIDSMSGLITGVPQTVGQFVIGVRVTEYRDGVKIGELNRDFQFNVADCESQVDARIQADEIIGDQAYALTSCGQQTITFQNTSTIESQIFSYGWEFPTVEGDTIRSTDRNATIAFPDTGLYLGSLYLNKNSICEDSATIAVRIFPETIADFEFAYDTCEVGPIDFVNLSTTESEMIETYNWDFGGLGTSSQESPRFFFPQPSTQPVSLTAIDVNGCESISTQDVIWQPAPQTVIVQPNTFLGCAPADIDFVNLSTPIDESYTFNWDFGDGNTSNDLSPSHVYESPGVYDISLEIISPIGCQVDGQFNSLIRVEEGPTADFTFTPTELSSVNRQVLFTDRSIDANTWFWNFGTESFSLEENPNYVFQDTGLQEIRLIITKANGCQDTILKTLDIIPIVNFHMPNAFTPNSDGVNEIFLGKGQLAGMREFQFSIWNRWGEQVFSTNNPTEGWNGRKNNVGKLSPLGAYPYVVSFREPRGGLVRLKGFANLIQ